MRNRKCGDEISVSDQSEHRSRRENKKYVEKDKNGWNIIVIFYFYHFVPPLSSHPLVLSFFSSSSTFSFILYILFRQREKKSDKEPTEEKRNERKGSGVEERRGRGRAEKCLHWSKNNQQKTLGFIKKNKNMIRISSRTENFPENIS